MITERRFDDPTRAAHLETERSVFERLDHLAAPKRPEITSRRRRATIGVLARKSSKVGAVLELLFDVRDLRLCLGPTSRGR